MANLILIHPDLLHHKDTISRECTGAEVLKLDLTPNGVTRKGTRKDEVTATQLNAVNIKCAGGGLFILYCHCSYKATKGLNFISEDGEEGTINGVILNSQIVALVQTVGSRKIFFSGCNTAKGGAQSPAGLIKATLNETLTPANHVIVYGITKTQSAYQAAYHMKGFLLSGTKRWNPVDTTAGIVRI
jgi:hypothetical protein